MDKIKLKMFIFLGLGLIVIGLVFFYGKKMMAPVTMENKIVITTSFYPVHFLVSQVGGDLVNVINLTPAGREPHDYELTSRDIINIKKSKLLFLNGGGLEVWREDVEKSIKIGGPSIISLGDDLMSQKINAGDEIKSDPHIWLSPVLAIKMSEKIASELIRLDPKNEAYYNSNLSIIKTKLINLDAKYKKELNNCKQKNIITAHAAFGYLSQAYDLKQVSIAGLSPEEEPSTQQLAEVVKFSRENEIKYIFFESLASPKLTETLAKEVGAQTLVLNPIEGLSEEEIDQGKNYLTEMEKNLENLKIALECNSQ